MKKVLIVHATAGIGHVKAALAIEGALAAREDVSYQTVDILDYTNGVLKWAYRRFYIILVKYTPLVWAAIYYFLDLTFVYNCVRCLRTFLNRFQSKRFIDYILEHEPDVIVSTHFFPSDVISYLKRKCIIKTPLISVITDFQLHSYWFSEDVDLFVVADDILKQQLKRKGVDEQRVKVLGIPIDLKFHKALDRDALYGNLKVKSGLFTVVIASGGFGVGPVSELVGELRNVNIPMQLVVICGKNRVLYEDLEQAQKDSRVPIAVYGFVDNMHEFMDIGDVLVSKSGGMTASEALSKELPMVIVSPIPGQEARNCDFLVRCGTAVREDRPSRIKEKIIELFNNKESLELMKKNIRAVRKPEPARNLADVILNL